MIYVIPYLNNLPTSMSCNAGVDNDNSFGKYVQTKYPQLMPAIHVGSQIFDVVFHPTLSIAYIGLLDGHIKAFAYNEQGYHKALFSLRPVKKSCRGLSPDEDGSHLYAVGKGRALRFGVLSFYHVTESTMLFQFDRYEDGGYGHSEKSPRVCFACLPVVFFDKARFQVLQ